MIELLWDCMQWLGLRSVISQWHHVGSGKFTCCYLFDNKLLCKTFMWYTCRTLYYNKLYTLIANLSFFLSFFIWGEVGILFLKTLLNLLQRSLTNRMPRLCIKQASCFSFRFHPQVLIALCYLLRNWQGSVFSDFFLNEKTYLRQKLQSQTALFES